MTLRLRLPLTSIYQGRVTSCAYLGVEIAPSYILLIHTCRKRKLPLLLISFAIHCLTKASAFVPQCLNETMGYNHKMKPRDENHMVAKRNFPSCSLRSQFTASQKLPLLFPNARMEPWDETIFCFLGRCICIMKP